MSKKKDNKDKANRTGVISCRLPGELKLKIEALAQSDNVVLSHVLRDFITECIDRGNFYWWCDEAHLKLLQEKQFQARTHKADVLSAPTEKDTAAA